MFYTIQEEKTYERLTANTRIRERLVLKTMKQGEVVYTPCFEESYHGM